MSAFSAYFCDFFAFLVIMKILRNNIASISVIYCRLSLVSAYVIDCQDKPGIN